MNNSKQQLNWLTIAASGLFSTVLLITSAQAADLITNVPNSAMSTVTQTSSNQLIAARKKQPRKKKIKQRIRVRKTIIKASSSPQTDLVKHPHQHLSHQSHHSHQSTKHRQ